jgi:hypothetical protein
MSLLQRSRFETVSSLAFLFQVFTAVPQWGHPVFLREIHEGCQRRLTQLRRASQGNLIFAIKFQGQQSSCFLSEVLCSNFAALRSSKGSFTSTVSTH